MPNDPFYSTAQWRRIRVHILNRDGHTCQLRYEGCLLKATEVDHVFQRQDLPPGSPLHWDTMNLRAVCKPCHSRKTNRNVPALHAQPSRAW